jgi:PAS domain S-box-containing protein
MKILLIEDNPADQEFVKDLIGRFRGTGYDLVTEDRVGKGLPHFTDRGISVILLDLNLPDSRGIDTFNTVYRLADHIPIIVLTGLEDDGLALKAVEGGAQDYLVKGQIDARVLEKAIQYAIERHRILRELRKTSSRLMKEEEVLDQREKTLQTLMNAPQDTISLLDRGGTILEINEAGASRLGKNRRDLIGMNAYDLLPPEVARSRKMKIDRVFETGLPEHFEDDRDGLSIMNHVFPIADTGGSSITRVAIFATDITSQKKIDEQLRVSETLYRTVFEATGAATAILDANGTILRANCEAEALFGYSPAELEGKIHWSKFVPQDELPRLAEYWRLLHEDPSSPSQHYEAKLVDRWGRIKYGILSVRLIPHSQNCVVSITDITERRRSDEAIGESEERFRGLFDHMASGVAVFQAIDGGKDFIFQDFNAAAERIDGVAKKDLVGRRVTEMFPGVKDLGLMDVFQRVWTTGVPEYLPASRYRDEQHPASWRENWVYRLPTGEIVAVYNDVSDRKKAEEALRESEEKFRTVLANVPDLVLVHHDGMIRYVNNAAIYTMGFQESELLGKPVLDFIVPEYRERVVEAMRKRQGGEWVEPYEIQIRWKYGEKTVLVSGSLIQYEGKAASLNVLTDITDRKRAEERLRLTQFSVDTAADAVMWLRADGSFFYVNDAACRMLRYPREKLLTMAAHDLNPAHPEQVWASYYEDLRKKGSLTFEASLLAADGRLVPVEITANYLEFEGKAYNCSFIRDLTERKQIEERIAHLASFPELNPNPVIELDSAGEVIYANPAVAATLAKNALGDDPRVFLPPDFQAILPTLMEGDVQKELRIGTRVFLETISRVSQKGTVRIYTRDITDRKRMEEELRESQAKLAEAMDIAKLVNWEFDVPIQIFTFDDRFYKLYGTTVEREGGTRMSAERYAREFCHPDDVHMVADEVKKAIETTDPNFTSTIEHRIVRRDGEIRHIVVRYSITKDAAGRTIRTQGANQDITDRKLAEEALRRSEENFARAFNSNPAALAITRIADGTFLSVNEAYNRIMGYGPGEILGRNVADLNIYVNPGERDRLVETLREEGSVRHFELLVRSKSGEKKSLLVSMEKVLYDDEESILSTFIDITDRKRMEEELRESEEKYRNLVELASTGIAILQDGLIMFANQRLGQIWGGPVEDLVKVPVRDVIHPDEREKIMERYRRRMAGETLPSIYETVLLRRDGSSYPAELHAGLITYQGRPADLVIIQDITERRRAEKALRESRERYRQIVEGTNAGVWVFDNQFSTIYANEQMAKMLGTRPGRMLGQSISEFVFPEDRADANEVFARIADGTSPDTELRFRRKDQLASWLRVAGGPFYDVRGQRIGITGVFSDVTASRLAEEAVRQAEEKYRNIVEFAVEGIYQIDTKGRFLTANSSMARILGYASVEDLLSTVTDTARQLWVHREQRLGYLRHLKDQGTIEGYEAELFRKSGEPIWVSLNTRAVKGPDGTIVYSEGTVEDITQRKLAEQALRESEEMFRNPVEQSPVGVFLVQDGVLLYANPKLAEMTGFPVQDIVRKPFGSLIHPDDMPKLLEKMARLLRGEVASDDIEFRSIRKDGSVIEVQAYGSSMLLHGRPAIYGTIIDITDRKRMEVQIKESLKEKEVLLREIHHRVKNNMQVISSLLSVQAQNIRDEGIRGLFKESQNRIRSIALVHELLYRSENLDQIEYGAYLKKMFIPLFESYSVDQRKIAMAIEAPKVMITIEKAVPCSLIVNELISNSLKHAFPGDRKGEIRIGFRLDEGTKSYVLEYGDNGVGLPPGLDASSATTLGMRLIHGLTKQLQGSIEIRSHEGAHFRIAFPAGNPDGGGR